MKPFTRAAYISLSILLFTATATAGEVKIAVAANFTAAMKQIAKGFEQTTGHKTRISYGSTGKLYAQILHRAPFEVFLSADSERPQLLVKKRLADQQFTYAIGKLALWSSDPIRDVSKAGLKRGDFKRIALANPKTAPYGAASVKVMEQLGVAKALRPKWVRGDNIAQTHQFIATGNAEVGFVALAQIVLNNQGKHWVIPQDLYEPIHQDAVLLTKGKSNPAASAFLAYLKSDEARKVIGSYGYGH